MLYVGQGDVIAAKRTAGGGIGEMRNVGEAPVFEVSIQTDTIKDHETSSGLRREILSVPTKQTAEVTVTFKEPTPENLAFLCYGTEQTVEGVALANAPMPSGLLAGKTYRLPNDAAGVSNVVIHDSTPTTPLLLVEGTHYEIDEVFGTFTPTAAGIAGHVQPFKVSCDVSDEEGVSLMDKTPENITLILHGVNTADDFAPEIWELYNVQANPTDKLPGKGEAVAEFTIKGSVLIDPTKPRKGKWGQFGRIRKIITA